MLVTTKHKATHIRIAQINITMEKAQITFDYDRKPKSYSNHLK